MRDRPSVDGGTPLCRLPAAQCLPTQQDPQIVASKNWWYHDTLSICCHIYISYSYLIELVSVWNIFTILAVALIWKLQFYGLNVKSFLSFSVLTCTETLNITQHMSSLQCVFFPYHVMQRKHTTFTKCKSIISQTSNTAIATSSHKVNGFHKLARCPWYPTGDLSVPSTDQSTVYSGNYKGISEGGCRKASAFYAEERVGWEWLGRAEVCHLP